MHSSKNLTLPQSSPLLSVIVPIRNEVAMLPQLFATLNRQDGIDFELILVDGGSTDRSIELATKLATAIPFSLQILSSPRGRASQMNIGAATATGEYLLFLHADSTLLQTDAFLSGLYTLKCQKSAAVAARFSLSFASDLPIPQRWRVFHTAKARQNRRGCIHGDQGFLLSRDFFAQVGPFDETLPFLEDDRLSDAVFAKGSWILLPTEIITSARRFAAEGFWQRDLLNMLILSLHQSGYGDWLSGLAAAYRGDPTPERIRIAPALIYIQGQLRSLTYRERLHFWTAIGRCLRDNLWQIRLFLN